MGYIDWGTLALGAAVVLLTLSKLWSARNGARYPPGPPGEFLIGNLRSMPLRDEDVYFTNLGKDYGAIVHMDIIGRHVVVINDYQTAIDLMERRSARYSGRPRFPMTEILGCETGMGFLSVENAKFRPHRRYMQRYLARDNMMRQDHRHRRLQESRLLASQLLDNPSEWHSSMIYFATALTIEMAVGRQITSKEDPYIKFAENISAYVTPALKPPEGSLIDLFPFMRWLPSWFPGNYWVGKARFARQFVEGFRDYALAETKDRIAKGIAEPSFLLSILEDVESAAPDRMTTMQDAKELVLALFNAGTDTTGSVLQTFIAALCMYPDCQEKAHKEIDRVIGQHRLPGFDDRESLPYVEGLMYEVLRWRPVLPLGVPHATTADDFYDGMLIPKGTVVMANIRAMGLDEKTYQDPANFDPSRYLPAPAGRGEPPPDAVFGFGRRACPGRFVAIDALWIAISTILATLTVSKPIREDGEEYSPSIEWESGITSHPHHFPCRMEPRTPYAKDLLSQE